MFVQADEGDQAAVMNKTVSAIAEAGDVMEIFLIG
jgi:hypothetical protein